MPQGSRVEFRDVNSGAVSVASVSAGQLLFGLLMDVLPAWLPLVLAGCCIGVSSLVFRLNTRTIE